MVQTAIKLNLFRRFTESSVPLSTKMLSTSLKVEPDLMARILRYLASVRFISEVGEGQYEANHHTHSFVDPRVEGGLQYT